MTDTPGLFRLVYASRNLLPDAAAQAEVSAILATARANNAALGITGALLFCDDAFVQALEGPMPAVEALFERIQCDPRHDHVVVLDAAPAESRHFAAWSMAYAGRRPDIRFADIDATPGDQPRPGMLGVLLGILGRVSEEPGPQA